MNSLVHMTAGFPPSKFFSAEHLKLAKMAEKAEIAWANCIVADVRKEASAVARTFGFNVNLVKTILAKGDHLTWQGGHGL